VVRTRVGYTGGRKPNPTYRSMGDHTESFQVDFDPGQISYQELLNIFWRGGRHSRQSWGKQYMTAVFTHSPEQKQMAQITRAQQERARGQIHTPILPLDTFYLAEDYHQKYSLRGTSAIASEYQAIYPELADFVNSTAVTRVNGFLGGHGEWEVLQAELDSYGLSSQARLQLRNLANRYR
jgi:methionine-S-sulfoxide reductase